MTAALHRSVTRFDPVTRERLDEFADQASITLKIEVPRSAVVRAAVSHWLAASDRSDPAHVVEAIRTSLVKRGRKAR